MFLTGAWQEDADLESLVNKLTERGRETGRADQFKHRVRRRHPQNKFPEGRLQPASDYQTIPPGRVSLGVETS